MTWSPRTPEGLGGAWRTQRGQRHLPETRTLTELDSVNFSCLGDNSSSGVLLPLRHVFNALAEMEKEPY